MIEVYKYYPIFFFKLWNFIIAITSSNLNIIYISYIIGLLHLNSIHPLWKILEKRTTGVVWFLNAPTFCVIGDKVITEGGNSLFRTAKWAYLNYSTFLTGPLVYDYLIWLNKLYQHLEDYVSHNMIPNLLPNSID